MNQGTTVQVQAVIYNNDLAAIDKAVSAAANAVRVAREKGLPLGHVTLRLGDASPEPVLTRQEVESLQKACGEELRFAYEVFGFNSGYGKGNNLLAEHTDADYLVIMNPDIILSPGYFIDTLAPFADPKVGLVEARQIPVEHHKDYNPITHETGWATGACFMIPTGLFQQLGGFDSDTFFMYCEDVDLSWRLRLAGYKLYYQPLSPVFHTKRLSVSGQWQPSDTEVYYTAISSALLPYKWSRPDLCEQRLQTYETSGNPLQRSAAEHVRQLQAQGKMPAALDKEHKIGTFLGAYYTENRFTLT